jgi:hypothetical protein
MGSRALVNSLPRGATKHLLGITVAVLACAAWPAMSWACKIKPYPDQFMVDPTLAASLPAPPALTVTAVTVQRSRHAPPGNGDCGEVGFLTLQLIPADGSAWPADIGVRLAVGDGAPPQAFTIPTYPLQTTDGTLGFAGGDDPSEPIDFRLQAAAVNAGGVESAPIEVHVSAPGRGCTCAIGGGGSRSGIASLACLALCGLLFTRARRRGKEEAPHPSAIQPRPSTRSPS